MKQLTVLSIILFTSFISYAQTGYENTPFFKILFDRYNSSVEERNKTLKTLCPKVAVDSLYGAICQALKDRKAQCKKQDDLLSKNLDDYSDLYAHGQDIYDNPIYCISEKNCPQLKPKIQMLLDINDQLYSLSKKIHANIDYLGKNCDILSDVYLPDFSREIALLKNKLRYGISYLDATTKYSISTKYSTSSIQQP